MNSSIKIEEIRIDEISRLNALAVISTEAARHNSPRWLATPAEAIEELKRCVISDNLSRLAMKNESPVGWISAFPINSAVWEIHPLLVDPETHSKGIGTLLVNEIERILTARGVRTIQVSTSDATNATTLSGKDLYIDPLGELQRLDVKNSKVGHACQFWVRSGYKVVGVLPDAEGMGIPSICLAKRLIPFSNSSY